MNHPEAVDAADETAPASGQPDVTEPRRTSKLPDSLIELLRFFLVGAGGYVIDVVGFNLLTHIGPAPLADKPVTAKAISVTLSVVFAWLGNRLWTFSGKRSHPPLKEFLWFVVVNIGGLVLSVGTLWISRSVLHLSTPLSDNISGNVIGTSLGTIFRYICYRYFVFKGPTHPTAHDVIAGLPEARMASPDPDPGVLEPHRD